MSAWLRTSPTTASTAPPCRAVTRVELFGPVPGGSPSAGSSAHAVDGHDLPAGVDQQVDRGRADAAGRPGDDGDRAHQPTAPATGRTPPGQRRSPPGRESVRSSSSGPRPRWPRRGRRGPRWATRAARPPCAGVGISVARAARSHPAARPRPGAPSSGSTASMREVSVRPACASPPGSRRRPHQHPVALGRQRSAAGRSASALPPWAETNTTPAKEPRAERTSSTRTSTRARVADERVPGKPGVLAARPVRERPAPPRRPAVGRPGRRRGPGRCGCRCRGAGAGRAARASPRALPAAPVPARSATGPPAGQVQREDRPPAARSTPRATAGAPAWARGSACRRRSTLECPTPGRGRSTPAASSASASSPWPYTHSGSGPSSGSPVKNLAAMQPPRQAS